MNGRKGLVLDANILVRAVFGRRVREILESYENAASLESISNWGLRSLLLNFPFLFSLHSRIPTNEGLPELVIEHLRPHLE